jgi:hypothetical protein
MNNRLTYLMAAVGALAVVVVVTALLVPDNVPAYEAAVAFANAAGKGDDSTAMSLLSEELQAWVRANCPGGSVSACVDDYTPPDWGGMLSTVFRRAQPVPGADGFDVQLVATYEDNQGFSGVCIYTQVMRQPDGAWLVTRWSGWFSCDDPNSGLSALISSPNVPNRAP